MRSGARAARVELILVLVATASLPFAFGGTPLGAYRAAAALAIVAAATALWRSGGAGLGLGRSARWLWPAFLLLALAALQAIPLPRVLASAISPAAVAAWKRSADTGDGVTDLSRIRESALKQVPEAAAVPPADDPLPPLAVPSVAPSPVRLTLSLQPSATAERMAWFAALLAAFLVVRRATAVSRAARLAESVLFGTFALIAAVGVVQHVLTPGVLYGVVRPLRGGSVFGPYVNSSHFAWVMELAVPWTLGTALDRWAQRRHGESLAPALLPLGCALLCAGAALLAASKAAFVLIPLSAAVVVGFGPPAGGRRLRVAVVAIVGAAMFAAAALEGRLGERLQFFAATTAVGGGQFDRARIWGSAVRMVSDFPAVGVGFGAFRNAIPPYLPPGDSEPWLQLHNDWMEVAVEGGLVAVAAVLVLALSFWRRAVRASPDRPGFPAGHLGLLSGLAALQVHALVDFGHQIPGNALLFVVASAMAVRKASPSDGDRVSWIARAAAVVLVALFGARAVEGTIAGNAFRSGMHAAAMGDFATAAERLRRGASGFNRFEAEWMEGDVRLGLWDALTPEVQAEAHGLAVLEDAAACFLRSGKLAASSAWPLDGLGSTFVRRERAGASARVVDLASFAGDPWKRVGPSGRIAVGLRRLSIERDPSNFRLHDALVRTLLDLGLRNAARGAVREAGRLQPSLVLHEILGPDTLDRDLLEAFAEGARESLRNLPMMPRDQQLLALGKVEFRLDRFVEAESSFREVLSVPADRVARAEASYWRGLSLLRLGRKDAAREHFEAASRVPVFRAGAARLLGGLARERGDASEALRWLRIARREAPDDASIVAELARVSADAGALTEAVTMLRSALRARPSDTELRALLVEVLVRSGQSAEAVHEIEVLKRSGVAPETLERLRRIVDAAPQFESGGSPSP